MNEQDKRNIEAVRRMYSGDEAERASIAPDIVWHVPGHNPVSGEYRGFEAYTQVMTARMAPLGLWDFTLESVMVNGDHVVTTWHIDGERKGKMIDMQGAHIMRLNSQGQVVEGWGFCEDQDAADDFFSE